MIRDILTILSSATLLIYGVALLVHGQIFEGFVLLALSSLVVRD